MSAFWRATALHMLDATAKAGRPLDLQQPPRWRWAKVLGLLALVPIMFWLGLETGQ